MKLLVIVNIISAGSTSIDSNPWDLPAYTTTSTGLPKKRVRESSGDTQILVGKVADSLIQSPLPGNFDN